MLKKIYNLIMQSLKKNFFTGLVIILPISATYFIVKYIVLFISKNLPDHILSYLLPSKYNLNFDGIKYIDKFVSFFIGFILIIIIGYFFSNYFGKKILKLWEFILQKLPFINKLYSVIKQIIEQIIINFQNPKKEIFKKVVLIEYPRKGIYSIGFISSKNNRFDKLLKNELYNVFIPTTPNPTSGLLIIVPKNELIEIDINIEDAMKYIISAGIVANEEKNEK